jgi:uncharacterized membrane protein YvlD (DUF360 family)
VGDNLVAMRQILGLRAAVSVVTAAGTLLILSPIVPGFDVGGFGPALAAAAISGLLNGLLWPLLARIALPLTVLTIGGAALVLNGAMLLLVAAIVPALTVDGLGTAIIGAAHLHRVLRGWLATLGHTAFDAQESLSAPTASPGSATPPSSSTSPASAS